MKPLNLIKPVPQTLLESERVILRRYTMDDLDRLDRLNSNVDVMRYIGDGSLRTREQTRAGIVRVQRIYEGPSEVHRMAIARRVLKGAG